MLGSASDGERVGGNVAAPVTGAGLKLALPLFWTPPCTSITDALTAALPLAERAVDELESTKTPPVSLMLAFPERLSAPPADGIEHDDRLADRDRAGAAAAGEEVGVSRVGRLDRVDAGRQARRREGGRARRERDAAGRQVGAGRGVVEVDGSGGRARARRSWP